MFIILEPSNSVYKSTEKSLFIQVQTSFITTINDLITLIKQEQLNNLTKKIKIQGFEITTGAKEKFLNSISVDELIFVTRNDSSSFYSTSEYKEELKHHRELKATFKKINNVIVTLDNKDDLLLMHNQCVYPCLWYVLKTEYNAKNEKIQTKLF